MYPRGNIKQPRCCSDGFIDLTRFIILYNVQKGPVFRFCFFFFFMSAHFYGNINKTLFTVNFISDITILFIIYEVCSKSSHPLWWHCVGSPGKCTCSSDSVLFAHQHKSLSFSRRVKFLKKKNYCRRQVGRIRRMEEPRLWDLSRTNYESTADRALEEF